MKFIHLKWPRGDSRNPKITILDGDGAAIDVSAATIKFTVRLAADDTLAFQKTSTAGEIVVSGASDNIATVTITAADTAAMTVGRKNYNWDLEVTLASGHVITPVSGPLTIQQDQTYT